VNFRKIVAADISFDAKPRPPAPPSDTYEVVRRITRSKVRA